MWEIISLLLPCLVFGALIRFGQGVSLIRGTLGGTIFSRNKSGAIARNYAIPTTQPTQSQNTVRALFALTAVLWSGLSASARSVWNALAQTSSYINKVGDSAVYSGQQLFMKVNNQLQQVGLTTVLDAPADILQPDGLLPFDITIGGGAAVVVSDTAVVPAGVVYVLEGTVGSAGKDNFKNAYRQLTVVAAAADWDTLDFETELSAMFGIPVAGQKVAVRAFAVSLTNGIASPYVMASTIAT